MVWRSCVIRVILGSVVYCCDLNGNTGGATCGAGRTRVYDPVGLMVCVKNRTFIICTVSWHTDMIHTDKFTYISMGETLSAAVPLDPI